jgi:RimJ/RimL family protein N-acetyltransferase
MLVFNNNSFDDIPMIDLYIGLPFIRNGYATEAIQLYFQYLKEHEMDSVYMTVLKENETAIQFLGSLGYKQIEIKPQELSDPSILLYKKAL